jgi:hypothetical protein
MVSAMALALGHQADAQESIQFIDGGDLQLLEPAATKQPQPWQSLAKDKAGTATTLTPAPANTSSLIQIESKPKLDGMRIGADIKLDESDQIELREASRLSFQADIGAMPEFSSTAVRGAFGSPASTAISAHGFDDRALFAKAAAVNPSKTLTAAMLRDPQAMVPHYAGLRIGYASGYSADDPLGLDPAKRGFEAYLTTAAMTSSLEPSSLSYLSVPEFAHPESAYNVGFNVGYRGFTLAGSYLHGSGESAIGYSSYDLGLSYNFGSWVTSVAVGGYFADRNPLSLLYGPDIDQLYSIEIGAAYELRPGIHVLGRLKVFDSRTVFRDTALDGLGGSLYLGTSFGF